MTITKVNIGTARKRPSMPKPHNCENHRYEVCQVCALEYRIADLWAELRRIEAMA